MKRKTFHLLPKTHKRLKRLSRLTKTDMTVVIANLVEVALGAIEGEGKS